MKNGPDQLQPEVHNTEENVERTNGERQGFFADRPDIPVEDIFGKGGDQA